MVRKQQPLIRHQAGIACLSLIGPLCGNLAAQTVFELDPYTVTDGPVIEQIELSGTAEAVTRVGEEQIFKLGAGDLAAALRRVPGVSVSRYNVVGAFGGGDGGAVFIRGQGAGRPGSEISLMTDGIARFVGVWTHPLLDTLPTDFAADIEVYKSPQPVRFGNMAFGAVNIHPRAATRPGWSGTARAEFGAYDTLSAYADAAYADERLNVHAGFSHRESDGHRRNADGVVDALQARLAWTIPGGWEASFLMQAIDSEAGDPEPAGVSLPVGERYAVENQFYLAQLSRRGGDWEFAAKAYVEAGELDWLQWHQPPPPPFPAQRLNTLTDYGNHGIRSRASYAGGPLTLTAGFDYDSFGGKVLEAYEKAPANRFGEQRFHLAAPHASVEWRPLKGSDNRQLILSAGARGLIHGEFDDQLAYQGGVKYQAKATSYYLNHALSHNYPGVFVSVFGRRPPPWNVGADWQDLEPEKITHWEAGAQHQLTEAVILNVAVFHAGVRNALRIAPPPPSGRIYNLGDYTVRGAELSLQGRLADTVTLFTGATFLDPDQSVPNTPEWTLTLAADWEPLPGWSVTGDVQFVDKQQVIETRFNNPRGEVDAYTLVNLRVSRRIQLDWAEMEVYLRADNVLDEDYEHRPGYRMPGATLTGGVRLDF